MNYRKIYITCLNPPKNSYMINTVRPWCHTRDAMADQDQQPPSDLKLNVLTFYIENAPLCGFLDAPLPKRIWAWLSCLMVPIQVSRVDRSRLYFSSADPIKTAEICGPTDIWHVWIFRGEENKKWWSSIAAKRPKCPKCRHHWDLT